MIKMAFRMVEAEYGLTKTEIAELLDMLPYFEVFPVVIEGDNCYAIGFMENDAYTEYLEEKDVIDSQIRSLLNDWVSNDWDKLSGSSRFKFDKQLEKSMPIIGDEFNLLSDC